MFSPSWTSLPPVTPSHPSRLSESTRFDLPVSYSKFPLVIYFTCVNAHVSILLLNLSLPLLPSLCPQVCSLCLHLHSVQFSSVQSLTRVWLFVPHESQHIRPPCPSPTPGVHSNSCPLMESVMPSNHLILCRPLLLLPSIPPNIRVFSNESTLRIRWPKYWSFSFRISPSNEHPLLSCK